MNDPVLQKALQDADEGRLEAAIASLRILSNRAPRRADVLQVLALLLIRAGKMQQAVHHLQRTIALVPNEPVLRVNLANTLLEGGKPREAEVQFKEALKLDVRDQPAWHGLLLAQAAQGQRPAWLATAEAGLRRWPDWTVFAQLYVHGLLEASRIEDADAYLRSWLERHPQDPVMLSARAHLLNYRVVPAVEVFLAHRAYGAALPGQPRPPQPAAQPERKLRLGILSGDLRSHSVGFFAEPFLARCPADFELVVFSSLRAKEGDPMAERFRRLTDEWHEVGHEDGSDAALDQLIRASRIDVLLDLSGHTWYNRLRALVHKPAPVLVHALGYPNTTGHPAFDARIVDSITDPAGAEGSSSERLLRLDGCFLCYQPFPGAPAPALPAEQAPVTFGSFNNAAKLSPETIGLWAQVLEAVPGSRLLLKAQSLSEAASVAALRERFAAAGVASERVEMLGFTGRIEDHLKLYQRVHVALDPLPYNGTTTTCEALWMGVPVVALAGDRHASRVGASLLQAAGCAEFLADDAAGYVRLAAELGQDLERLRTLRGELRPRLAASPLLDGAGYAERFYGALRGAWREWCRR